MLAQLTEPLGVHLPGYTCPGTAAQLRLPGYTCTCPGTPAPARVCLHLPRYTCTCPGTPAPAQVRVHLTGYACTCPGTPAPARVQLPRYVCTCPGTPAPARVHVYLLGYSCPGTCAPAPVRLHLPGYVCTCPGTPAPARVRVHLPRYACTCPDPERKPVFCTSCEEFVGKTCRRSSGFCRAKHPDFMCQTRRVYTQHFTGEYLHQYSALGCPRRCAEYVRLSPGEKSTISCCNQSYCNSPTGRDGPPSTTQLRGPVQPPADRVDLRQGPGPAAH
ncbi:hypothetical protein TREES_T100008318 [Tupaia chinensis]|uniref:Uncharacterized protein n=1 Tax=Tupaia chinensis TaxID=246437 RepID=L9LEL6_TUPCH|nr:hypothetical protein TREES_T100008318 [Tupaia chinensis]